MKRNTEFADKVNKAAVDKLVDVCHYNDGSITDLLDVYDLAVKKINNSWKFYDNPSRIYVTAFHTTLKYFGYERNSLP